MIRAHGWSCNKCMNISPFAEAFAAAGYACLMFDYRRWGASDGTPRHILDVKEQLDDYRTVIEYAQLQPEFDADRLIPSLRICAAIAQGPYTGVIGKSPLNMSVVFKGVADTIKQLLGLSPVYIPAAGGPNKPAALMYEGSEEGVAGLCSEPG
ncbi:hypothetical protein V5O48_002764 [Marasmius crinis-equi]|uniref:Serine aminopeptidase S33 domain-containing protein n=1 Tax=Marasmius crinis-equi TaxID=585013 RepID=A0ABR3FUT0_9AGAR